MFMVWFPWLQVSGAALTHPIGFGAVMIAYGLSHIIGRLEYGVFPRHKLVKMLSAQLLLKP
jgi:hypothetical protein